MLQSSKSKINQDEIKINEVGKKFFEIQFDAKKKIISRFKIIQLLFSVILKLLCCKNCIVTYYRLNDEINNLKKKTDKFKSKTNRLSNKLKDNYEYLKKILDEKNNLEKLLKAETAQLKQVRPLILSLRNLNLFFVCVNYNNKYTQEVDYMEEKSLSKLKKKDDEFIREAGKHKSITAIYGRK